MLNCVGRLTQWTMCEMKRTPEMPKIAELLSKIKKGMELSTLSPEFDHRFQRCFGSLLEEMGRRGGTLGLISGSLGVVERYFVMLGENVKAGRRIYNRQTL
jgi:hypothetical protein